MVINNNKYDSMGRSLSVIKKIDDVPYKTQTAYDLSGKVKKLTYPDNYFITYAYYPGTNLIQTITDSNNIVQAIYTDYEPTGKIGQIDYHNGTATKYTYDAWSTKLFGIVTEDPTRDPAKNLQNREYTYSRAGDIIQIKDNAQKVTYDYTYDMLHRLVSEKLSGINAPIVTKVETITLDYTGTGPVHGVKTITLNGVSRTCAYDANGNMTTSPDFTNAANPLNRAITYDADNMPTRIVHANGATVDFMYDGIAKRTKKLVQSGKTVLYLGDHFEVENGINIKYIFGGNLRLAQIKGSLTSYFHKDHLGSTAAVTNEAGVKVESTTYTPFGDTRIQEGTPVSAYKFTDQELDNETNLYNYDARLYDPVLGMFVTPDSMVPNFIDLKNGRVFDPQMLNRYAYCRNNPLIYTDPSGHHLGGENGPEKGSKDLGDNGSSIGLGSDSDKDKNTIVKETISEEDYYNLFMDLVFQTTWDIIAYCYEPLAPTVNLIAKDTATMCNNALTSAYNANQIAAEQIKQALDIVADSDVKKQLIDPLAGISGPLTGLESLDEALRGIQHFGHIWDGSKKKEEH